MDDYLGKITCSLFFFLAFLQSCTSPSTNHPVLQSNVNVTYAKGFSINKTDDYTRIVVKDPWDSAAILHDYVLMPEGKILPDSLSGATRVTVPVKRLACLYTLHAGMLDDLGVLSKVVAVAEPEYIDIPAITDGLKKGAVKNLGQSASVDIERLIEAQPDLIIASPLQGVGYGNMEKCGIPIAEDASYMENSPLGRAEWIKFIAAFVGRSDEADSLFGEIEKRYLLLKALVKDETTRPTIFSEKKYGQTWYVPGGKSYMATLFADAGCEYPWMDTPESGSIPLSIESVYEKAEKCDYWVIKDGAPHDLTYASLASESKLYTGFYAWRSKKIIYTNTMKSRYFEKGTLQPDRILADFIHLVHPELLPDHAPVYFKMMDDE